MPIQHPSSARDFRKAFAFDQYDGLYSDSPKAGASFIEVVIFFCEAEAEQIFAVVGTEECGAGDRCYAGNCE
jgi:hypothetical protein